MKEFGDKRLISEWIEDFYDWLREKPVRFVLFLILASLYFAGVFSLFGCGIGGSSSVVKRDPVTGLVTTETRTNSVGITKPAPVATASEAAYANAIMTNSAISQQYMAAQLDWTRRNNLPPSVWPGLYGAGIPVTGMFPFGGVGMTGVVGTYTPAGAAVAAQLRPLLSPNPLNITVIQGVPVTGANPPADDSDSNMPPPAPSPPRFDQNPPAPMNHSSETGPKTKEASCLEGSNIADALTDLRGRISTMLDTVASTSMITEKTREFVIETDQILRDMEVRCHDFESVRRSIRSVRTDLDRLRRRLRTIGGIRVGPIPVPSPIAPGAAPSPNTPSITL